MSNLIYISRIKENKIQGILCKSDLFTSELPFIWNESNIDQLFSYGGFINAVKYTEKYPIEGFDEAFSHHNLDDVIKFALSFNLMDSYPFEKIQQIYLFNDKWYFIKLYKTELTDVGTTFNQKFKKRLTFNELQPLTLLTI